MRIIAVGTLKKFWSSPGRRDAEVPLRAWVTIVKAADWTRPNDVRKMFGSADLLSNGCVVFNIGGNKYRLVAAVHYRGKRSYVRFIGTHEKLTRSTPTRFEGIGMEVRPIRTKADYRRALKEVERLWDAEPGTPQVDRIDVLMTLIEAYEGKHFPILPPDPIAAIEFMLEQKGLTRRDLEPAIGSRGRVSEVLNKKRPLTLPMVRALSDLLDIPMSVLAQAYPVRSAA